MFPDSVTGNGLLTPRKSMKHEYSGDRKKTGRDARSPVAISSPFKPLLSKKMSFPRLKHLETFGQGAILCAFQVSAIAFDFRA